MAALITVYDSNGVVGRCDAKCYAAKQPECDCVCGGVNHGVGLLNARAATARQADEWVKAYQERKGIDPAVMQVTRDNQQPDWTRIAPRTKRQRARAAQLQLFAGGVQ